jgi:hypothetical protein
MNRELKYSTGFIDAAAGARVSNWRFWADFCDLRTLLSVCRRFRSADGSPGIYNDVYKTGEDSPMPVYVPNDDS